MLFLNASKRPGLARAGASLSSMAEILRSGRFSATTRSAKATAPARRSSPTTSSTMPISFARAARTGSEPQLPLGETHLPRGNGHTVVTGQAHFEPAAERGTVDRRHHRLGA